MDITPIKNMLDTSLTTLLTLVPVIVGIALFVAGCIMAFGNHNHGRERGIWAMIGGAVMLGAKVMGAGIKV